MTNRAPERSWPRLKAVSSASMTTPKCAPDATSFGASDHELNDDDFTSAKPRRDDEKSRLDQSVLHREGPAGVDPLLRRAPRVPARFPGAGGRPVLRGGETRWRRHHAQGHPPRRAPVAKS